MAFDPAAVGIATLDLGAGFMPAFEVELASRLGHRADTFRIAFQALMRKPHLAAPVIAETGCLRDLGNWAGDGQSTFLFDCFAQTTHGLVYSVDTSAEAVATARSVTSDRTQVALGDSVSFLAGRLWPIDLLYLDSLDLDINQEVATATHHLFELTAAMRHLQPGSIVIIDDTTRNAESKWFGKGRLVSDYLGRIGATLLAEGSQAVWQLT